MGLVGRRINTGMSAGDVAEFMDCFAHGAWDKYGPPGKALQIPIRFGEIVLVTRETIAAAHHAGLEVHVWTVNDPGEIERVLDIGADGIMSDLPGLVTAAVAARPFTS